MLAVDGHMPKILAGRIAVAAILGLSLTASGIVAAQDAAGDSTAHVADWTYVVDGRKMDWPAGLSPQTSDEDEALEGLLVWYRRQGYYAAAVDSVKSDSLIRTVWLDLGTQVTVGRVILTGPTLFQPVQLLDDFGTQPGKVLDVHVLERDIDRLLTRYEKRGMVLASAQVVRVAPAEDDPTRLEVAIHIDEGPLLPLGAIEISGRARTRPEFVSRATGLRIGKPLVGFDPAVIRDRLETTELFTEIDSIRLAVNENQEAILRIALKEEPPGAFDALLGYLPNAGISGGGTVVGDVNILLRHVLGGGRSFAFRFQRNPGSVTRVNVRAEDPFIFGLPFRLAGHFDGFQQDSTYDSRSYGIEGGYRIQRLELFANGSRELTRPGSARSSTVPSSDSWFAGVGFSYRTIASRASPRKGVDVESVVENGRKERETFRTGSEGQERVLETVFQQRLRARARLYAPVRRRSVAVLGVDTRAIQSGTYDEADLVRFGGANSMRGYNEDQFRGNLAIRLLSEWRYLLERRSFLFAFVDFGYINLPEVNTVTEPDRVSEEWLVGYGMGLQIETEAGLFKMSLAFNADDGIDAKVHLGMTLGL
jgi:outer membrane protein assembly factor BamA